MNKKHLRLKNMGKVAQSLICTKKLLTKVKIKVMQHRSRKMTQKKRLKTKKKKINQHFFSGFSRTSGVTFNVCYLLFLKLHFLVKLRLVLQLCSRNISTQ